MWNELLPIGSVVLLSNSEKRLMVMGFCQAKPEDTQTVYDYCGCLYPEGYMDAENIYLFNHEQVAQVFSLGYMDMEQFEFRDRVTEVLLKLRGVDTSENPSEGEDAGELPELNLDDEES